MKKIILIATILMSLITVSHSKEWYEGGTLHNATMAEWSKASAENKLATCGDWVSGIYNKKKFKKEIMALIQVKQMNGIKEISEGCVTMLNSASGPETANEKSNELFLMGTILADWVEM